MAPYWPEPPRRRPFRGRRGGRPRRGRSGRLARHAVLRAVLRGGHAGVPGAAGGGAALLPQLRADAPVDWLGSPEGLCRRVGGGAGRQPHARRRARPALRSGGRGVGDGGHRGRRHRGMRRGAGVARRAPVSGAGPEARDAVDGSGMTRGTTR